MTILKTKADVDSLAELRERKAALQLQMDSEKGELQTIWQEVRSDLQPGEIVGSAIKSMLGISAHSENSSDQAAMGLAKRLNGPLRFAADMLVRDPRVAMLLKVVTPLTVAYLPSIARKAKSITPGKKEMFGFLRRGVAGLRKRLKKEDESDESVLGI